MNQTDREIIISIVSSAFEQNPRAVAMMKKKNPSRSVRLMTEYAYQLVEKFDGIYLSKDKTTVLFYYKKSQYKRKLIDYIRYLRMFMKAIRPSQLFPTLKREKHIVSLRPDYEDYIYVWVLGSVPNNKSLNGLSDIRDHLFGLSEKLQLPILIETTVEKVLKLYRYVGFEEYHKWEDTEAGINVWFLERKVNPPKRD
ncbi:MAG: hypothetical protein KAI08_03850 [Bacteroidales bacterium]|nr:hypothetical protein [Bacteroidales bacterium]